MNTITFWAIAIPVLLTLAFLIMKVIYRPFKKRAEQRRWNQWKQDKRPSYL